MATIQENIEAMQAAYDAVKEHCMCRVIHDDGAMFRVLYPEGFQLDGVQSSYLLDGKAAALGRILDRMEKDWLEGNLK